MTFHLLYSSHITTIWIVNILKITRTHKFYCVWFQLKMRSVKKHLNKAGIEPRSTRSIWHQATALSVNTQPRDPKDQQSLYQLSYSSSNKTRLLSFSSLYFFKGTRWNFFLSFFLIRWLDLISLILLRFGHQRFSQLLSTNSRRFLI